MAPLRLCAVSFLNAWPLYQVLLEQPPVGDDGQPLFELQEALPAERARMLADGECDVALVPVASYLEHPEWEVVPEVAIAARGAVQTVVVVSELPLAEVTTIHCDAASRSSLLLLRTLLATEGLDISFSQDGLRRIAETAWQVNEKTENIGARRLHTVMERLLEEVSFSAADSGLAREPLVIDAAYVDRQLQALSADEDLSRFIL